VALAVLARPGANVRLLPAVLLLLSAGAARAQDEDDDLFKDTSSSSSKSSDTVDVKSFSDDDDLGMPTFTVEPPKPKAEEKDLSAFTDPSKTVGASTKMPVDTVGKTVLADNWGPTVVVVDTDAVVVEMPVLYGVDRKSFDGVAYWLVAEAFADGKKVAESRVWVATDAIADKGPSVQFFRLLAPVAAQTGVIEVKVGKAASPAAKPTLLFTRSVPYKV
jgi:hypothetical protein